MHPNQNISVENHWIPLIDFSIQNGVSLSTLRRAIRAQRIPFKLEHGKYYLKSDTVLPQFHSKPVEPGAIPVFDSGKLRTAKSLNGSGLGPIEDRIEKLESGLRLAREEIAELKTLLAFYEERFNPGGQA